MVEVGTLVILLEVALQYDWTNHEHAWVLGQQESTYLLVSHAFTLAGVGPVDWLLRYLATTPACGVDVCMCLCEYTYVCACVHFCVYVVRICWCVYVFVYVSVLGTCMCVHVCVCMFVSIFMCVCCMCVHECVCMFVCMFMCCMCVHICVCEEVMGWYVRVMWYNDGGSIYLPRGEWPWMYLRRKGEGHGWNKGGTVGYIQGMNRLVRRCRGAKV